MLIYLALSGKSPTHIISELSTVLVSRWVSRGVYPVQMQGDCRLRHHFLCSFNLCDVSRGLVHVVWTKWLNRRWRWVFSFSAWKSAWNTLSIGLIYSEKDALSHTDHLYMHKMVSRLEDHMYEQLFSFKFSKMKFLKHAAWTVRLIFCAEEVFCGLIQQFGWLEFILTIVFNWRQI